MEYLRLHSMAPLHHLFDDHHLCDPSWCHKRKLQLTSVVVTPLPPTVTTNTSSEADAAGLVPATPPTNNNNETIVTPLKTSPVMATPPLPLSPPIQVPKLMLQDWFLQHLLHIILIYLGAFAVKT